MPRQVGSVALFAFLLAGVTHGQELATLRQSLFGRPPGRRRRPTGPGPRTWPRSHREPDAPRGRAPAAREPPGRDRLARAARRTWRPRASSSPRPRRRRGLGARLLEEAPGAPEEEPGRLLPAGDRRLGRHGDGPRGARRERPGEAQEGARRLARTGPEQCCGGAPTARPTT
jgi:hypothetical protein